MGHSSRGSWLLLLPALALAVSGVDTLIPSAVSAPNDWLLYAGVDKVVAVAPPTDSLASAISAYQNEIQRYALPAPDIPAGATIDSVCAFVQFLCGAATGVGARPGLYLGGDTTEGAEFVVTELYPVWDSAIVRVLKPGGGTFTEANLGDMELFLRRSNDEYAQLIVTTLDVFVHWTQGGGATKPKHHATMMGGS